MFELLNIGLVGNGTEGIENQKLEFWFGKVNGLFRLKRCVVALLSYRGINWVLLSLYRKVVYWNVFGIWNKLFCSTVSLRGSLGLGVDSFGDHTPVTDAAVCSQPMERCNHRK